MRGLLGGVALTGVVGAVAAESAVLEAVAALVAVVSGSLGLWWTWRDRKCQKEKERLEVELLRERLHDQRRDGNNDDGRTTTDDRNR